MLVNHLYILSDQHFVITNMSKVLGSYHDVNKSNRRGCGQWASSPSTSLPVPHPTDTHRPLPSKAGPLTSEKPHMQHMVYSDN